MIRQIDVSVYCHWSETPPVYRIYVNSELMAERTFSWPGYQVYIREHLVCNLDPGIHTVTLENCSQNGKFELEQFWSDGPRDTEHPNYFDPERKKITFIVNQ